MDLRTINKANNSNNEVAFSGIRAVKDETGNVYKRVWLPNEFELGKDEELGLEVVKLTKNKPNEKYGWSINENTPIIKVKVDDDFKRGKSYFDLNLKNYRLANAGEFGYRFVVYDKKSNEVKRTFTDNVGSNISTTRNNKEEAFTVASTRQSTVRTYGPMNHAFSDAVGADIINENEAITKNFDREVAKSKKTHINKLGGTINGIIDKLDEEFAPYKYIMTTPLIGGGSVSSHMYHPKNPFHVSEGTGDKSDFMNLQVECFKRGKGYVLDGAFTSQGYEGIQLNHALKWKDSPFKFWFKNPPADGKYALGTLPDMDKEHIGIRIVNPKKTGGDGYTYNKNMPTYIQFYDTRLADKQLDDYSTLITKYDKMDSDDPYEITTWHDGTLSNYFEVDPNDPAVQGKAYGSLKEWEEEGRLDSILNSQNYSFTTRGETAGTTGWDGNVDLVKVNLSNHSNRPELIEGSMQAKNQLYNIARYWTTETRNALIMDVANSIHDMQNTQGKLQPEITKDTKKYLNDLENKYMLKKGSLEGIYKKVLVEKNAKTFNGQKLEKSYNYKINDDKRSANDFVQEEILNFPLESLDFSDELISVLSTPYITPRPAYNSKDTKETILNKASANKLEVLENAHEASLDKTNKRAKLSGTMYEVYTEIMPAIVKNLVHEIQEEQIANSNQQGTLNPKLLYEGNGDNFGTLTPFGKYFLEMAMTDIMQFLVTEGLFDSETVSPKGILPYDNDQLDYGSVDKKAGTKGNGKRLNLNKLDIHESSSKDEAEQVAKKLKKGLKTLEANKPKEFEQFKKYLIEKYYNTDLEDYKIAEAVVDQTGGGLNWRFDAAKDVADWDETKAHTINSADAWDDVISCWKPFVNNILKNNDSSFIVAEVTSLHDFDEYDWSKYGNADNAERAFFEEIPATTTSNYSTTFGLYPKFVGKNIEEGSVDGYGNLHNFLKRLESFSKGEGDGHAFAESIMGSHVFLDNHDKPRAAHLMGLDAELYWSDFQKDDKLTADNMARAEKALGRKYSDDMSSKAVAVAEQYIKHIKNESKNLGISKENTEILTQAVKHLANGYKYCTNDKTPDRKRAEAFGVYPFEYTIIHVIEQAESMGLKMTMDEQQELYDKIRADMTAPYRSKFPEIYDLMLGSFGIPTLFAGDEFAQTGSEWKTKNWGIGCRNAVRHDWIRNNKKEDVVEFYNRLQAANNLNNDPRVAARKIGTPTYIIPNPMDCASKDSLVKTMEFIEQNNPDDLYKFIIGGDEDNANKTKEEYIKDYQNEVKNSSEEEFVSKFRERMEQLATNNTGLCGWIEQNIHPDKPEVGAIARTDENGGMVLTLATSAFIPKNVEEVRGLLTPDEVDKIPKFSDVSLKDSKGKLLVKPGTKFIRKTFGYNNKNKKYEYKDNGLYVVDKNGKLKNQNGEDTPFDAMTSIFCKASDDVYNPWIGVKPA